MTDESQLKQKVITSSQYARLNAMLGHFLRQTKCSLALLADTSGLVLAQVGPLQQKGVLLGSLAAANYAATFEMAKQVGEQDGFQIQFHEGKDNNIYITDTFGGWLLVVVFSQSSTFAMIRVLSQKLNEELKQLFASAPESSVHEDTMRINLQETAFQAELSRKLDQILAKKE